MPRYTALRLILLTISLLCSAINARADDAQAGGQRSLAQMHHTAWGPAEGAPAGIYAIAQGADGYLWLGTHTGVFRFDGVRFETFAFARGQQLPSLSVDALLFDRAGRLWIGSTFGGVSRLDPDGKLTSYDTRDGLPRGSVRCLLEDLDGTVWACTSSGLAAFHGKRWEPLAGLTDADVALMTMNPRGALWLITSYGVCTVARHTRKVSCFEGGVYSGASGISVAPDGAIWLASTRGIYRLDDTQGDAASWPLHMAAIHTESINFDSHGSMWFDGNGLGYIAASSRTNALLQADGRGIDYFTPHQGLSGKAVTAQLEDREGNIWIGTSGGLDRFRTNRLQRYPTTPSLDLMLHAAADGALWVGGRNLPVQRDQARRESFAKIGLGATAMLDLPTGGTLVATRSGLWRVEGNTTRPVATALPVSPNHTIQALEFDRQGRLWLSQVRSGLYRQSGGRWQADPVPGLFAGPAVSMHRDGAGRLWLGYPKNHLAMVAQAAGQDTARRFDEKDGLTVGNILAIHDQAGRLWVGGDRGVAAFDGKRFHRLVGNQGEDFAGASGLTTSADGALWIHNAAGIARIDATELERARHNPDSPLATEHFNYLDGLPGQPAQLRPIPTITRAVDGRLWFVTDNGAVWIDPSHIARNNVPPPVQVLALRSGGHDYGTGAVGMLPALTRDLEIRYTAASLTIPERVRFRYRLDGVDRDWNDVGTRRTAYYNNLAPGHYLFHVIACNEDGVWNMVGASLAFAITPTYYQTNWFRGACALLAGGGLWLLLRLRLRILATRHQTRLDERERIARELHDTLLQSTQGLIVHFQAVADRLPEQNVNHGAIRQVLDEADSVLAEGRDRVLQLRQHGDSPELGAALATVAGALAEHHGTTWHVHVDGAATALRSGVGDELLRIASEAIANAFRHACAQRIDLGVSYDVDNVTVTVRDDGRGIPAAILRDGARVGHWGLPGMRERAASLGAPLLVESSDAGTLVILRLPAALAYKRSVVQRMGALMRRLPGLRNGAPS